MQREVLTIDSRRDLITVSDQLEAPRSIDWRQGRAHAVHDGLEKNG